MDFDCVLNSNSKIAQKFVFTAGRLFERTHNLLCALWTRNRATRRTTRVVDCDCFLKFNSELSLKLVFTADRPGWN